MSDSVGGPCRVATERPPSSCRLLLLHILVFIFFSMNPHCTRKVIGGELQERLIPVPYSKTSTDQAVRFDKKPALSFTLVCSFLRCPYGFVLL